MVEIRDMPSKPSRTTVVIERHVELHGVTELVSAAHAPGFIPVLAVLRVEVDAEGNGSADADLLEGSRNHPGARSGADIRCGLIHKYSEPLALQYWLVDAVYAMVAEAVVRAQAGEQNRTIA